MWLALGPLWLLPFSVRAQAPAPPSQPVAADSTSTTAPEPAPVSHAERVGWDEEHPVTENVYFRPGHGLTAESRDGLFKLSIRVRGQLLYSMDKADDSPAEQSFSIRRARLVFDGHFWGADNFFKVEIAMSPRDVGLTPMRLPGSTEPEDDNAALSDTSLYVSRSPLLDMYVQFKQLRDFNVRIGQYKIPFSRQRVISSGNLMFVDRSIVNSEFTLDRDLGFDFRSKDLFGLGGRLRYYAGVFTGEGHSSFADREVSSIDHFFGLNTLVRLEVLPMGDFDDYSESDVKRTSTPKLSVGATFAHLGQGRGDRGIIGREPSDDGTTDFLLGEADAMFKWRGLSAQLEFVYRRGKRNADGVPGLPLDAPRNGWGLTGQAGYVFPVKFELAVRHSAVRGAADGSLDDRNETALALGYYLAGHPFKVQADLSRLYGPSIGNGAYLARTQLQAAF